MSTFRETTGSRINRGGLTTPANRGFVRNRGTRTTTPRSNITRGSSNANVEYYFAIAIGRGQASGEVGIACVGTYAPNLILSQFSDNQNFTKTLSKINLFQPRKVLLNSGLCSIGQKSRLVTEIEREYPYVEIVAVQRRHFNNRKGLRRINALANEAFSSLPPTFGSQYYALAAAGALLKYIESTVGLLYSPKTLRVQFQVSERTALIDSSTAKHLELVANNANPSSLDSLLGILEECKTPTGSRYLRASILQPPCDQRLIMQRLDCVEELVNEPDLLYSVQATLSRLPVDIEQVISSLIRIPKLENAKVLEQRAAFIVALKHVLDVLPALDKVLGNARHPYFQHLRNELQLSVFDELVGRIDSVINEEAHLQKGHAAMRTQRTFLIKAEANAFLDLARRVYCEIVDEINEYVTEMSTEAGLPLQLGHSAARGFFLAYRVNDNEVVAPPDLPSLFLQVQRQRNIVSFTTERLLIFDRREKEVLQEIDNLSDIIVAQLVTDIREKIGSLYKVSDAVANLDLLHSLATYSLGRQVVRPKFSQSVTSITKGRHPILDRIKVEPTVPNDTFVSTDVNVNVITGPNMSGKTTYLKQVATLQIMAQIGCFVPAKAATFRIANGIFSRLGSEDNIEGNASTFAVEMNEMSFILKNSAGTPLVIIDELGRSTSVEEGTAMSWALLESLMKTKAFVLFATHFLFLTKLEKYHLNVLNYKMEAKETVSVSAVGNLYGLGDEFHLEFSHVSSRGFTDVEHYGLQLAKKSSLPHSVVARGQDIAEAIIAARQKGPGDNNDENKKRRGRYLLGSHLSFAAEALKDAPTSVQVAYLKSLQLQFMEFA